MSAYRLNGQFHASYTPIIIILFYFCAIFEQSIKQREHSHCYMKALHSHSKTFRVVLVARASCKYLSLARSLENVSLHFHHIGDQLKEFLGSTLKDCSVIFTTNFPLALQISFISIVKLLNSTKKKFFNVHEVILFFLQLFV